MMAILVNQRRNKAINEINSKQKLTHANKTDPRKFFWTTQNRIDERKKN